MTHDELIKRLESTSGQDRELDRFLCPNAKIHPVTGEWRHWNERKAGRKYGPQDNPIPAYTSSIDAALTLVPEGSLWSICDMEDGPFAQVIRPMPGGGYVDGLTDAKAATPAIALCVAALKARQCGVQS